MQQAAAPNPIEHFHPLEVIPFFRRFPSSIGRDLLYTLIWNSLFGLGVFMSGSLSSGRFPPLALLPMYLLIANVIGYAIHALFMVGEVVGLEGAARRAGHVARVAYYALVPIAGVVAGFAFVSTMLERRFLDWVTRPGVLASMLVTSLVISVVLSVIFFWRRRCPRASARAPSASSARRRSPTCARCRRRSSRTSSSIRSPTSRACSIPIRARRSRCWRASSASHLAALHLGFEPIRRAPREPRLCAPLQTDVNSRIIPGCPCA